MRFHAAGAFYPKLLRVCIHLVFWLEHLRQSLIAPNEERVYAVACGPLDRKAAQKAESLWDRTLGAMLFL